MKFIFMEIFKLDFFFQWSLKTQHEEGEGSVQFNFHFIPPWDIYPYPASFLNIPFAPHAISPLYSLLPILQDPNNICTSLINFLWQLQPTLLSYFSEILCSYSLYHKIRHLITYCLVCFSNCVMAIFSSMLACNFSTKDQVSCISISS